MKLQFVLPFQTGKIFALLLTLFLELAFLSATWAAPVRETTPMPVADLKALEGSYQLTADKKLFIRITAQGDKLTLKESWTNKEISFNQKAELSFVATDNPDFTLDFTRDKTGAVNQVTAFKRDVWVKVKPGKEPVQPSPAAAAKSARTYETIFTAFQAAINSNADDKIRSFIQTYMDESVVTAYTMDNLIEQAKSLYQNMGEIQLDNTKPINTETGTATFKGKSQGNQFWMTFTLNPTGKITRFEMKE
jgi:hypothetical protein